jgi:hypothetical protein
MRTARKYRNQASKRVILSIGSRLEGDAFDLPVPCEIGHSFEPSFFIFLRETLFAFRVRHNHKVLGRIERLAEREQFVGEARTQPIGTGVALQQCIS